MSTKVIAMMMAWTGLLRIHHTIRLGLIAVTPMTISSPAKAGMATWPTVSAANRIVTAITAPAMKIAIRVRAPAATASAVAPIAPPTGIPRNTPESRLPTP